MIEYLNILIFPILITLIFKSYFLEKIFVSKLKFKLTSIENLNLNLLIILNLILFFSLFDLKVSFVNYFLIFLIFLNLIPFFLSKKNLYILLELKNLLLLFIILSLVIIVNPDLGWDGKFHWYKRALNFFQEMGLQNLSNLPKYEYPHFGSYLWAIFWKFSFVKYEYFGRLFYLYLYLLSIFSILDLLKNTQLKTILFFFIAIVCFNKNHFLGNQDIIIFSLNLFLARYLYFIFELKIKSFQNYFFIFLICNILFWIKYETIVYISVVYVLIIFFNLIKKNYDSIYFISISFILIIFLKLITNYIYDISHNASFQFSGAYDFSELFSLKVFFYKIFFLIKYYLISLFKNPIMLITFLSILFIYLKKIKCSVENLIIYFLFNLSSFGVFYIIQNEFSWHVINGIDRYILQFSSFSIIYFIISIDNITKK